MNDDTFSDSCDRSTAFGWSRFLSAMVLAMGLAAIGYFPSMAALRWVANTHTVTVKGLADRTVKADLALWPLRLVVVDDDITRAQEQLQRNKATLLAFLVKQGLTEDEVTEGSTLLRDRLAAEYVSRDSVTPGTRFVLTSDVRVRSPRIEAVQAVARQTSDLAKAGVVLAAGEGSSSLVAPYFLFTKLNVIKPEMVAEATANARIAALQFVHDSGVALGPLVSASQGQVEILPFDPTPGAQEELQPTKTVRLVSTVTYAVGP